jgi:hypothetical protein
MILPCICGCRPQKYSLGEGERETVTSIERLGIELALGRADEWGMSSRLRKTIVIRLSRESEIVDVHLRRASGQ